MVNDCVQPVQLDLLHTGTVRIGEGPGRPDRWRGPPLRRAVSAQHDLSVGIWRSSSGNTSASPTCW